MSSPTHHQVHSHLFIGPLAIRPLAAVKINSAATTRETMVPGVKSTTQHPLVLAFEHWLSHDGQIGAGSRANVLKHTRLFLASFEPQLPTVQTSSEENSVNQILTGSAPIAGTLTHELYFRGAELACHYLQDLAQSGDRYITNRASSLRKLAAWMRTLGATGIDPSKILHPARDSALSKHPFVTEWTEYLKANGSKEDYIHGLRRAVVSLLEFTLREQNFHYSAQAEDHAFAALRAGQPPQQATVVSAMFQDGTEIMNRWLTTIPTHNVKSIRTIASRIRKFAEWLEATCSQGSTASQTTMEIRTPISTRTKVSCALMKEWGNTTNPSKGKVYWMQEFSKYIQATHNLSAEDESALNRLIVAEPFKLVPDYQRYLAAKQRDSAVSSTETLRDSVKHALAALRDFYAWAYRSGYTRYSPHNVINQFNQRLTLPWLPVLDTWLESAAPPSRGRLCWARRFISHLAKNEGLELVPAAEDKALKVLTNLRAPQPLSEQDGPDLGEIKGTITWRLLAANDQDIERFTESLRNSNSGIKVKTCYTASAQIRAFLRWIHSSGFNSGSNSGSSSGSSCGLSGNRNLSDPAETAASPSIATVPVPTPVAKTLRAAVETTFSSSAKPQLSGMTRRTTIQPGFDFSRIVETRNDAIDALIRNGFTFTQVRELKNIHVDLKIGVVTQVSSGRVVDLKEIPESCTLQIHRYRAELLRCSKLQMTAEKPSRPFFVATDGRSLTVDDLPPNRDGVDDIEALTTFIMLRDTAITALIRDYGLSIEYVAKLSSPYEFVSRDWRIRFMIDGEMRLVSEQDKRIYSLLEQYRDQCRDLQLGATARAADTQAKLTSPSPASHNKEYQGEKFFRALDGGPLLADARS